ncbi:MAG: hypothetical protein KNN16_05960 [Thermoflexus hugenholtzii]|jgi:hypothetical protein|uniref:hypothetical protein n=1 Tax=Thermoflexus TaxID=1495649 RepID=UPI001C78D0DC|nr:MULTISPECIES: hypothetical protein [Thermoflexus]QWK11833.1 MAG: hypothetical protein KNN16_05960 [Thermoflexus hugenholtzii]
MAVRIEKAGPCWTQPVECLARWGDCLLRGACEGADPKDLLGLLPWLAVVGIPVGGVVFALLPPWARRRRWAWPRLTLPPPRVPLVRWVSNVGKGVADRWENATQGVGRVWEGLKATVEGVWGKVWNNVLASMVGIFMLLGAGFLADRRLSGDPGEGNGSGIPFPKRAFAVAVLVPFLLLVDVSLFLLTLSNTVFLLTFPDPASRILSLSTEIGLIMCDLFLVFVHLQLAHWAITGRWIRSVEDLTDWSLRP